MYTIYDLNKALSSATDESGGTKAKEWITFDFNGCVELRILYKMGRKGTGENWAEKVTCELAELINLPHAKYEFGCLDTEGHEDEKYCVITPKFQRDDEELFLGNLLIKGFDRGQRFRNNTYTLRAILASINGCDRFPWKGHDHKVIRTAQDLLIGYLCFDGWVCNTDRHDENWGIIVNEKLGLKTLAPTFDHASSLGRNENDEKRVKRMNSTDKGFNVEGYVKKAITPIYNENEQRLNAIDVVKECLNINEDATVFWIKRIIDTMSNEVKIKNIFDCIPNELISNPAKKFALEILKETKNSLKGLLDE
tara:strand:+ start:449 stop:1375 length:927 start_codon:yes stop_codon:yes gene_type:complete